MPEKRLLPVTPGQRVALGARRIHVLPTPVSSFSVVAATEEDCARIAAAPLLQALSTRMVTRVNHRVEPAIGEPPTGKPARALAPPGVAAVESGSRRARVEWLLRHGASQVLCLDPERPVPTRVVIHAASDAALRPTMAVASSMLRNLPVEAAFLDIQPPELPGGRARDAASASARCPPRRRPRCMASTCARAPLWRLGNRAEQGAVGGGHRAFDRVCRSRPPMPGKSCARSRSCSTRAAVTPC